MSKLFLPQATIEEWALSERADVLDERLTVAGEESTYRVTEAVHLAELVSGDDEHQLAGKVKTLSQLELLGAENLSTSVIAGESAYDVVQGYIVEAHASVFAAPEQRPVGRAGGETDLLAAFLLNKL